MRKSLEERFWEKVAPPGANGCQRWLARSLRSGYGSFYLGGGRANARVDLAHRVAYRLAGNEIPDGYVIDHVCRNPWCVAPEHLEAVTQAENVRRGAGPEVQRARHARVTHCPTGHEYTPENTYRSGPGKRYRQCRTCRRDRDRAQRARAKE